MTGTNSSTASIGTAAVSTKLWDPSYPEKSGMYEFMRQVNRLHGLRLIAYDDLYEWSINNIGSFWELVWDFTGIRSSSPFSEVSTRWTSSNMSVQAKVKKKR